MPPRRKVDYSHAWLRAIEEATACLRQRDYSKLDSCQGYLDQLESALLFHNKNGRTRGNQQTKQQRPRRSWDRPPSRKPPQMASTTITQQQQQELLLPSQLLFSAPPTALSNTSAPPPHGGAILHSSYNPYSEFQSDEDSTTTSSSGEDDDDDDDVDVDGGDQPVLNVSSPPLSANKENSMDIRRLLIRILTYQSEVFAARALVCKSENRWNDGAVQYTHSLQRIHTALEYADSEISRWIAADSTNNNHNNNNPQVLIEDADIVQVAIQSLVQGREKFESAAKQQEQYLLKKLQPQWESRDKVKARLGEERWTSNPRPKLDYVKIRQDSERQLRDIRAALQQLQWQVGDTTAAQESYKRLQEKVVSMLSTTTPSSSQQESSDSNTITTNNNNNRYNGTRPTAHNLSRRVSWVEYPDPTEFGWTFTGSIGVVEFFEKDQVKLDWYYTTATVKTSLHHPTQGKTQLFGAKVDPETYRKILLNPRQHTGKRYQRKPPPPPHGRQRRNNPSRSKKEHNPLNS